MERGTKDYKAWRDSVFDRDNYTCQKCGAVYEPDKEKSISMPGGGLTLIKIKGNPIHAHHIKQFILYPELATDLTNGITLCESCHKATYKKNRHATLGVNINRPILLRFTQSEALNIKRVYRVAGVKPADGILLSALYVLQEIEAGRLRISKAGLFPRR